MAGAGGHRRLSRPGYAPAILHFDLLGAVKTFLLRIWGILWFPVNWSRPLEWWLMAGMACGVAGSLLLLRARPARGVLALCLAGIALTCIPTHNMLLIGPSLERARYLTLAVPLIVLALGFCFAALPRRVGLAGLALMVAFHAAAMRHNLMAWRSVSTARYTVCRNLAERARASASPISLTGMPLMIDGVYWRNGLEDCLDVDFGIPPGTVLVNNPEGAPEKALPLRWSEAARELLREH